ncbi:MAG TPA: (2Fe-2S)-binding protein [Candidatus Limnocylindrales bacterium]|nr:(2Fe-2S)-binding protein [Candidatus Limnocylindrales bacterium]
MTESTTIRLRVNGVEFEGEVEPRLLLSDFLRHRLGLTGTHVGCEHGVCGACTVEVDGAAVRSCLMFAIQADGTAVRTIEGLANDDGSLGAIQEAFRVKHGLQCGFCTPGILMSFAALDAEPGPHSRAEMLEALGGHLCRCTGYRNIVQAGELAIVDEVAARD